MVRPRSFASSRPKTRASSKVSPRSTTSAPKLRVFSTFTDEAKRGMTMVAAMPMRCAWYATACAWLPAETASTPPARSAAVSCAILLNAPRSLNDAVNCRFSNFRNTSQPQMAERVRDSRQGVSPISPRSRVGRALDVGGQRRVRGGAHGRHSRAAVADTSRHRRRAIAYRTTDRPIRCERRRSSPPASRGERAWRRPSTVRAAAIAVPVESIMSQKFVSSLAALALAAFSGWPKPRRFLHGLRPRLAYRHRDPDRARNTALIRSVSAGGFTTILNGGPSFESYCVDLYQNIAFGAPPYTEYASVGRATCSRTATPTPTSAGCTPPPGW